MPIWYFLLSPIAAWLLRVHAEDKPVWERFMVIGPVHRDDPILLGAEAGIQRYREPSQLGTFLAAVDGHDVCGTLQCPLCSTPLAVATFMTAGTKSSLSAHSARLSLRMLSSHAWVGIYLLSGSLEGFRPDCLPSPGLVCQPSRYRGVAAVACHIFLEPQVRVGCRVDFNAGRAALERTRLAPCRCARPLTPRHPKGFIQQSH